MSVPLAVVTPADVFYVVESSGRLGQREHDVASVLYETHAQAHTELTRLKAGNSVGDYDIWRSSTYIEPPSWLYCVVLADGTVIPAVTKPARTDH
ncbi:MAG TPA: hypothetical protein VIE42_14805 [Steroidobacteraceae bacterium]|jgi:hypothetical protein